MPCQCPWAQWCFVKERAQELHSWAGESGVSTFHRAGDQVSLKWFYLSSVLKTSRSSNPNMNFSCEELRLGLHDAKILIKFS